MEDICFNVNVVNPVVWSRLSNGYNIVNCTMILYIFILLRYSLLITKHFMKNTERDKEMPEDVYSLSTSTLLR